MEKFWSKVDIKGEDECWEWLSNKFPKGYGSFRVGDCNKVAHRYSWELYNKVSPGELHVLHKCDNRGCVNPNHLFLGTNQENVDDKMRKGRYKLPSSFTDRIPCEICGRPTQKATYKKHLTYCKSKKGAI